MIVGQSNMQDNSTKKMKMMKHDIRSPLSCMMMCCNFSLALTNADKESLLNFTEQILNILDSATNIELLIHDMHRTLASFKRYCDQSERISSIDKKALLRSIERISRMLNSPASQVRVIDKKINEINIIVSINNILSEKNWNI